MFEALMKGFRKGLLGLFLLMFLYGEAQVGFGLRAGFQQSFPIVLRDSFEGAPTFSGGLNLYLPGNNKVNFVAGLGYRPITLNYKEKSSSLNWRTIALNLGTEWLPQKMKQTIFYTDLNLNYILSYRQKVLSGTNTSGNAYIELDSKQNLVPSLEFGVSFKPKPHIRLNISTIQTIPQTTYNNRPTLPGSFSFSLEYYLTKSYINSLNADTTPSAEKIFTGNLKTGTLYFIENNKDSNQVIFHKMFAEFYNYSEVKFIKAADLSNTLDSFKTSADSSRIFIAKAGVITYDIERSSTQGIILYDYKMENPVPGSPFFVRVLAGDSDFQDPEIVKKMIKTLNSKLYKMYNANK